MVAKYSVSVLMVSPVFIDRVSLALLCCLISTAGPPQRSVVSLLTSPVTASSNGTTVQMESKQYRSMQTLCY